ncbi:MAG: hypothetical protein LUE31_00055 [Lachnospiraceae bacterium]|nr:hypothetical protein [Lachnospiraceae bacterium]
MAMESEDTKMKAQTKAQFTLPCKVKLLQYSVKAYTGAGFEYVPAGSVTQSDCPEIVEVREGKQSVLWGHLKSGAGWIPMDQVKVVQQ